MVKRWLGFFLVVPLVLSFVMVDAFAITGKTAGLNPRLIAVLYRIESHFRHPITITSGCRSHAHNRSIGGARESFHLHCLAADIKLEGVDKSRVAKYAASLSGRGGIGTYCHDASVHVDLGPRREWYWGCAGERRFSQGSFQRSTFRVHRLRHKQHH